MQTGKAEGAARRLGFKDYPYPEFAKDIPATLLFCWPYENSPTEEKELAADKRLQFTHPAALP